MELTIRTPNLIGHVLQTDVVDGESFTHPTAMCGAKVTGTVESRRLVCGKCVALLIENRNAVNKQLDLVYGMLDLFERRLIEARDAARTANEGDKSEPESGDKPEGGEE